MISAKTSTKKQINEINLQQSNFSELFCKIAEQIANQQDWMLDETFNEILGLINDDEQKKIVTIDNIFSVNQINRH